ncbi:MAG: helix-turn-helix transcriptional regulator [Chitinophagales bacterium]|nr:helix-turn-helix transcriptional regulator [Chitinophagales bacterium]
MERRSDCPLNCFLELLGDKWTLLILRDVLFFGKRHFSEFLASRESIATNILSDRLSSLVENGFLVKAPDAFNKQRNNYLPTKKAEGLKPVLMAIADWTIAHEEGVMDIRKG